MYSCEEGGACVIGSKFIPPLTRSGTTLGPTIPSPDIAPSGCACGGDGTSPSGCTGTSGCAGSAPSGCVACGGAASPSGVIATMPGGGYAPSGRLPTNPGAPLCGCKSKGNQPRGGGIVYQGTPYNPPNDRPTSTFIPPPPPSRQQMANPRIPLVTPPRERVDIPSDGGKALFIPPPPPPQQQIANTPQQPTRVYERPIEDVPTVFTPPQSSIPQGQIPQSQQPTQGGIVTTLPSTPQDPNPFGQWCGAQIDAASELCRNPAISTPCREQLIDWLKSGSKTMTLREWVLSNELCQPELIRILGWVEGQAAAKTSARLYGASSGMPRYYRASGVISPSRIAELRAGATPTMAEFGDPMFASIAVRPLDGTGVVGYQLVDPSNPGNTVGGNATAADWMRGSTPAPPVPETPPVDYGRLIAGIGQAVGGVFQGVNTAVANANDARIRELAVNYQGQANAGQLAIQRATLEMQQEIARLASQGTPAANATVTALQQQVYDANARLEAQRAADAAEAAKMGTGTIVALVAAGVAVLGLGGYVLLKDDRRGSRR